MEEQVLYRADAEPRVQPRADRANAFERLDWRRERDPRGRWWAGSRRCWRRSRWWRCPRFAASIEHALRLLKARGALRWRQAGVVVEQGGDPVEVGQRALERVHETDQATDDDAIAV